MQKIIQKIEKEDLGALDNQDIDCFLLFPNLSDEFITNFVSKAQSLEKIVLLWGNGSVSKCVSLNCDGVIVDLSKSEDVKKDMENIKSELGDKKFLGVIPRARKHEAMIVSEFEPDFVVFKIWNDGIENMKELVAWYSEFFILQSAIILEEDVNVDDFCVDIVIK